MPDNLVNIEIALKLGISSEEFEKIIKNLKRTPNFTELCLISAFRLNKNFDTNFTQLFKTRSKTSKNSTNLSDFEQTFIRISDEMSCFMNTESNDLPYTSGPYSESSYCLALAGRNVIASGATPVAILNTFRLGLPEFSGTKKIAEEFLKGVGEIGNALGYPVVGAKINFEKCFDDKPEHNTLVVGLIEHSNIHPILNESIEYSVYIVSDDIKTDFFINEKVNSQKDIQDIITKTAIGTVSGLSEKKLHESTLEAMQTGAIHSTMAVSKNGLLQGLANFSANLNKGFILDFNKILPSQPIDKAFGALFSGQFANLVLIIERGKEKLIEKIYNKWELKFKEIGKIYEKESIAFSIDEKEIAELPISLLQPEVVFVDFDSAQSPIFCKEFNPGKENLLKKQNISGLADIPMPENLKDVAWFLIKHPNIASKKWINEQYDTMAGISNMSTNFISDAILINLKGTNNALALCMTGNQKHFKADPSIGAQIAVAAACRKIVCSGAKPLAVQPSISFLNFNHTEDSNVFEGFVSGLYQACNKFKLPINNENIKINTETNGHNQAFSRCPSLTVGMLGLLEDKNHQMTISFKNKGNIIFLIGPSTEDISASEYLVSYHKRIINEAPFFDLELEYKLQSAILGLIKKNYVCSVHNVTRGGLFISLVESAMISGFGFDIISDTDIRLDAFLFGESQGRVLVSINPNKESNFIDYMMKKEIPYLALGHVTKGEMRIDDISFGFIEDAKKAHENALEKIINK